MKLSKTKIVIGVCVFLGLNLSSCKKFVELDPPKDRLNYENAYATNATAASVLNGLYIRIIETSNPISNFISPYMGVASDELKNYYTLATSPYQLLYTNNPTSGNDYFWSPFYSYIYHCNAAIEGLEQSTTLTSTVKDQLIGEAKFMRAYCYFYLVNIFGKVPLLTSSDYRLYINVKRDDINVVYQQILNDLIDAQSKLSKDFLKADALNAYPVATAERVRPTYWAATAMLARTYLYQQRWAEAEAAATLVLNNTILFEPVPLASAFLKNSRESIFQLQNNVNTAQYSSQIFVLVTSIGTSTNPVAVSDQLKNAYEPADLRSTAWMGTRIISGITYTFPNKYKSNTATLATATPEYLSLFRIGEQYLIRSEARAMQNNIAGAAADLNVIRRRARGLAVTISNTGADVAGTLTQPQITELIIKERQLELFTEQGHRWFDLKRTGRLDGVMSALSASKGATWQSYKQLFPIPVSEIGLDPNLDQNPGYN